jgi:sortase A
VDLAATVVAEVRKFGISGTLGAPIGPQSTMPATTTSERVGSDPVDRPDRLGRWLRGAGWTLVWLGALTIGFVVHQLYITTWLAQQNQGSLSDERVEHYAAAEVIEAVIDETGTVVPVEEVPSEPGGTFSGDEVGATYVPITLEAPPERHSAFALIRIPSIDRLADGWNVVEGVSLDDLKNGAGHMPSTPLPGQPGNSVISGHRTTYGAPFHELDELVPGDRIEVETAIGVHVYEVRSTEIVRPTDVWVTEPRDGAWLTLTTCHPRFSARQRLVVFAELVDGPNLEAVRRFS